ncbi:MAG: hypothetical protein IJS97_05175 [Prevotella sp.]|nr:hypothetical protein [Prevotella sp.]
MKFKPMFITLMSLLLTCQMQAGTATFATQRLQGMASYLKLSQLDTLQTGVCEAYRYQGRTLVVRVNEWGEVEHIGLKLFPSALRVIYPSPIYDFLERYLLERNASPRETETGTKMGWDKVHFGVGTAATALSLDSTAEFSENHVDLKVYRVEWAVNGQVKLQFSFDMDYQLMSGCTEIELEKRFLHILSRQKTLAVIPSALEFPHDANEYVYKGGTFISSKVRGDRYYTKQDGQWHLVSSMNRPTQSIANVLLDANSDPRIGLTVVSDQYGYNTDSLHTTYRQFLQQCINEGCEPYYGMKTKETGSYTGTVFLVNRKGGYLHMLSVRVPTTVVTAPELSIVFGRLYTYIPLFNVSTRILNPNDYQTYQ